MRRKVFLSKLNNRRFRMTLCAVLALIIMLVSPGANATVLATDGGSSTLSPEKEEDAANTTTPEGEPINDDDLLKDSFGEVVMYRWTRVDRDSYPTDAYWHPTLLVYADDVTNKKSYPDWGYIAAEAPGCFWRGPGGGEIAGSHKFSRDDPNWVAWFKDDDDIDEDNSDFIKISDSAQNITVNDPQVKSDQEKFFTNSNRNCIYVKYGKRDDDNEGLDGMDAPVYAIKMTSEKNVDTEYYLEPYGVGDQSGIHIHDNLYGYEWSFKSYTSDKRSGDLYRVFYNKPNKQDPRLNTQWSWAYAESDDQDKSLFKWFIGEMLRFSALKGNVTIGNERILSISSGEYISSEGKEETVEGVFLPAGETITIEKGGILSIEGTFLNNGTIINNGGTILIKDGGSICPFLQGDNTAKNGCGAIICNGGDIIIESGGALYAGMNDDSMNQVPFYMDNSSTMIVYGLVVYGSMRLGDAARIELRSGGKMYGSYYGYTVTTVPYPHSMLLPEIKKKYEDMGVAFKVINGMEFAEFPQLIPATDMMKYNTSYFMSGTLYKVDNIAPLSRGNGMYISEQGVTHTPHVMIARGEEKSLVDPNMSTNIMLEVLGL